MSRITTGQLFAEWQQMNQKLLTQIEKQDEIIAKQQALIDRLNNPIDTQLTGSIMEDGLPTKPANNNVSLDYGHMSITSGNVVLVGSILDLSGYDQISVGVRLKNICEAGDINVLYRWHGRYLGMLDNARTEFDYVVNADNKSKFVRLLTKRLTLSANKLAIYLRNNSSEDIDVEGVEVFKYV